MHFPQRDPLSPLPLLQLYPEAPQHFRAPTNRTANFSQSAAH